MGQATVKTAAKSCSFLFTNESPDDIFVREEVSDEQKLFARTAEQFMRDEVAPQAEQLYQRTWTILKEMLGPGHPMRPPSLENFTNLLREQGNKGIFTALAQENLIDLTNNIDDE